MSTRDIAATTRKTHDASSSPAKSTASSASSSASCDAAPPSNPSSGTGRPKVVSAAATLKAGRGHRQHHPLSRRLQLPPHFSPGSENSWPCSWGSFGGRSPLHPSSIRLLNGRRDSRGNRLTEIITWGADATRNSATRAYKLWTAAAPSTPYRTFSPAQTIRTLSNSRSTTLTKHVAAGVRGLFWS